MLCMKTFVKKFPKEQELIFTSNILRQKAFYIKFIQNYAQNYQQLNIAKEL